MLSREEIIATYEQGPDAVVALVEGLITAFQQQIEQLNARIQEAVVPFMTPGRRISATPARPDCATPITCAS